MNKENKFGQLVKLRRAEKEIHLKDLGELTGVSMSFWSDVERGNRMPSVEVVLKLAKALKLTEKLKREMLRTYLDVRCAECKYKRCVEKSLSKGA